jgi:transposase
MHDLDDFLAACQECKRALAVKFDLLGYSSTWIENWLGGSGSFLRKWRTQYARYGVQRFYLQYQGSRGYLSPDERAEVITFLNTQEYYGVDALQTYVEEQYDVIFTSKQSYDDL